MEVIQYRATTGGELQADMESRSISGYGIVFNSDSLPMRYWDEKTGRIYDIVEQITRESLEGADMSDVLSAFNHDFDKILGRTSSNTLKLSTDQQGVKYRAEAPNTTYANDVLELLRRGDVRGSSFVFSMDWDEGYQMEEREDGTIVAKPKKIMKVYEIGPVSTPAYPETTAQNRSAGLQKAMERFLAEKERVEVREEVDPAEAETRAEEPTQNITYPAVARYTLRAKVNDYKKRV